MDCIIVSDSSLHSTFSGDASRTTTRGEHDAAAGRSTTDHTGLYGQCNFRNCPGKISRMVAVVVAEFLVVLVCVAVSVVVFMAVDVVVAVSVAVIVTAAVPVIVAVVVAVAEVTGKC